MPRFGFRRHPDGGRARPGRQARVLRAFPQTGAPAGVALATVAFYLASQLDQAQFGSWGWRLPFLFSAVLVLVGLVIRLRISESPEFEAVRTKNERVELPIKEAFRRTRKRSSSSPAPT